MASKKALTKIPPKSLNQRALRFPIANRLPASVILPLFGRIWRGEKFPKASELLPSLYIADSAAKLCEGGVDEKAGVSSRFSDRSGCRLDNEVRSERRWEMDG
jgi:hypothetical protein